MEIVYLFIKGKTASICIDMFVCAAFRLNPILNLAGSDIDALAQTPGRYSIKLTCSNFLGATDDFVASFDVIGTPVPSVTVVGAKERKFTLSEGFRISAYINPESVCPGNKVEYSWIQISGDGEQLIPVEGIHKKDIRVPGPVTATAQHSYTILLTAFLLRSDSTDRSQNSTTTVTLIAVGSEVSAELVGASGDVIMKKDLVLSARCNDPDDPEDVETAFSYDYDCIRSFSSGEDGFAENVSNSELCPSFGIITGSEVILGQDALSFDIWHTYTVTCAKFSSQPDGSSLERSATASVRFIPRSPESLIPTASIEQQCGTKECPVKNNPDSKISFKLTNLSDKDMEITWSCTDYTLTEEDIIGTVNSKTLVIKAGVIKAGQDLECMAVLVKVDDDGIEHVGQSRIRVEMNSGPFCSLDNCVTAKQDSPSNVFPDAKYTLSASGFVDDEGTLEYEFGCFREGERKVMQKSLQGFFILSSLVVGQHRCFACGVDKFGTRACEYTDLEVLEPVGGVSESQTTEALDAVAQAQSSGDPVLVLSMVSKANNILSYETDTPGRRLLESNGDNTYAMVAAIVEQIENSDPLDFTFFKSAADELARMAVDYNISSAHLAAYGIGLGANRIAQETFSGDDVGNILTILSTYAKEWIGGAGEEFDVAEAYMNVTSILTKAGASLCSDCILGDEPKSASSIDSSMAGLTCTNETPSSVNGKNLTAGDVLVVFPDDFSSKCGEICSEEFQVELTVTYLGDSDLHAALVGDPVQMVGVSDVQITSGVISIQSASFTRDVLCENEDCWMILTIPVKEFNPNKATTCLKIDNGAAAGLSGLDGVLFVEGSYEEDSSTVKCNATRFGEVFVTDYMLPPPPPPPTPPPSPPPLQPPSPPSPPSPATPQSLAPATIPQPTPRSPTLVPTSPPQTSSSPPINSDSPVDAPPLEPEKKLVETPSINSPSPTPEDTIAREEKVGNHKP